MEKKRERPLQGPSKKSDKKRAERRAYTKPGLDSSEIFESFTLQSCDAVPDECGSPFE
jgi:hypothetical protein